MLVSKIHGGSEVVTKNQSVAVWKRPGQIILNKIICKDNPETN